MRQKLLRCHLIMNENINDQINFFIRDCSRDFVPSSALTHLIFHLFFFVKMWDEFKVNFFLFWASNKS